MIINFFHNLLCISVCVISFYENCSRAARNLTHFDVSFPQYQQLMLPYIVYHYVSPVCFENTASDAVLCQNFAVILL